MKLSHLIFLISPIFSCGNSNKHDNDVCEINEEMPDSIEEENKDKPQKEPESSGEDTKDIRIHLDANDHSLSLQFKNDTVVLRSLPELLTGTLNVQSIVGIMGSDLDETYCRNVKSRIESSLAPGYHHDLKKQTLESIRELNNIRFQASVVPFMDTSDFRASLKNKLGLTNHQPIRISNPYKIQSVKFGIKLADDAMTKMLGTEGDLMQDLSKHAMSFDRFSGTAIFTLKQADLACDLLNGKAAIEIDVGGEYKKDNQKHVHTMKTLLFMGSETSLFNQSSHEDTFLQIKKIVDQDTEQESEITIKFSDGRLNMKVEKKERILVTESSVNKFLPLVYRSRFVDYLSFQNGRIVKKDIEMSVTPNLKRIFELVNSEISNSILPFSDRSSEERNDLAELMGKTYGHYQSKILEGHNYGIMGTLIEYNPHHALVALDNFTLKGLFGKENVCQSKDFAIVEGGISVSKDLKDLIETKQIGFINLSKGFTKADILEEIERLCGHSPKFTFVSLMNTVLENVFDSIGSNEHVILAQSASYTGNVGSIDSNKERYPSRLRVGAMNLMNSDLDEDGVPKVDMNFEDYYHHSKARGDNADVYVNLAVDMRFQTSPSTLMAAGALGMGVNQATNIPSTSNAAPLALSRIIELKEELFPEDDLDGGKIRHLFENITPQKCFRFPESRCVFQDPIKHLKLFSFNIGKR